MLRVRSVLSILLLVSTMSALGREAPPIAHSVPSRLDVANPQIENRVTSAGNIWMNFNNYGNFGNSGPLSSDADRDPCPPGQWAPQCEFPAGSGVQYLFGAGLWVGALIEDEGTLVPRVSVGVDGWQSPTIHEFYPGEGEENGIVEISRNPEYFGCAGLVTYDPQARGDQEFISTMQDTLRDPFWVRPDPVDMTHVPLGIEIEKTARVWASPTFGDFVIFDYKVTNISDEMLRNVYVGLYVDADVGLESEPERHVDDIAGILELDPVTGDTVNIAWIADNDGRRAFLNDGPLECPHVAGTFLLSDNVVRPISSFNWWVSNNNVALDYGPAWRSHAEEGSPLNWTRTFGTPSGDERKYQLMSNCEFDFWQISVDKLTTTGVPDAVSRCDGSVQPWDTEDPTPLPNSVDIANGYDTRYLISWGPLGIYDYSTPEGLDIYRLNPGESFEFSFAYVLGEYFHNPESPQPTNTSIDSSLFDFTGLLRTAARARALYDTFYDLPIPGITEHPQVTGSVGNWMLSWDSPDVGNIAGYNIFATNLSGDSTRIQLNTNPYPATSISLPMVETGEDWLFEVQAVDVNGWEGALIHVVIRIGAAAPVKNVKAETQGGTVWLNWDSSPELEVEAYQVVRRVIDPYAIPPAPPYPRDWNVVDTDTLWSEVNRLRDETPMHGFPNQYLVAALNDLGVTSRVQDTVSVTPISSQSVVILVIDETDSLSAIEFLRGGIDDDSIRAAYEYVLMNSGIVFDYLDVPNRARPGVDYTLQELLHYDVVIWHSEDNVPIVGTDYLQRKRILSDYVALGGKLLMMGKGVLATEFGAYPNANLSFGFLPFQFDSVNAQAQTNVISGRPQFVGAIGENGLPTITLDPDRLAEPNYGGTTGIDYLPDAEFVWPRQSAGTEVLYRAVMHEGDLSGMANQPCGVYAPGAILLTWPLYFMQRHEAVLLISLCVNALRQVDTRSPRVSIGVVQNPIQSSYLDVYVVADEELQTPVTLGLGRSRSVDSLVATPTGFSTHTYHADYQLTGSDSVVLRCLVTDIWGNTAVAEKVFASHYLDSNSPAAIIGLPNGDVTLSLPEHGFSRSGHLLIQSEPTLSGVLSISDKVSITPSDWESREQCELCIKSYLATQALSERSVVIRRLENGFWTDVEGATIVQGNMVCTQIDKLGAYAVFEGLPRTIPTSTILHPAYPNPFNPATSISFDLSSGGFVNLSVYNVLGQRVRTLLNQELSAGYHRTAWDGSTSAGEQLASGLYFARLTTSEITLVTKLALVR